MKRTVAVDNQDFQILNIVASFQKESKEKVSSWEVCQRLFPGEDTKSTQNHLSSVIWRLEKLAKLKFLEEHPHPTREGKKVYSLPDLAFSVNGVVFIPSPVGGIILKCTYIENCGKRCRFGSKNCKLSNQIKREGLEPVLRIVKVLSKMSRAPIENNKPEKEAKKEECLAQTATS